MSDQESQNIDEVEPPRQETDLYGEPVLERQINDEYWEGYTWDERPYRLYIAKYERHDGEWIKTGLETMNLSDIHLEAFSRRKRGSE